VATRVRQLLPVTAPAEAAIPSTSTGRRRRGFMRRRSTLAFALCVPLFAIIGGLVLYPAVFAFYLATLNKAQTKFVGLANFKFLFGRDLFWMVVKQVVVFAVTAVFFKAILGFIAANLVNNLPQKGQRKWRGMMLVPWVIPPALSTLGWWWMFDPTYSALNWLFAAVGGPHIAWLSEPNWARFCVILVNVWIGTPFFMIMYLAALKSVPAEMYEVASVDGASAWQKLVYVTLPMMRNIIAVTVLFSLIVTFANYDIVRVLTMGGPRNMTHVLATYAFRLGIESGDIPLGASVSLVMLPILGVFAAFILRGVRQRTREL
jgi:multiple sugar transport system permease protein